jgi:Kef-type K+ transport system membrane component KefB
MFLVGLSFDKAHFRANLGSGSAVSLAGVAVPFLFGALMTPWLVSKGLLSPRLSLTQASLFISACISITAFPVLARIIEERKLANSPLGALSLAAGAIGDAAAWAILAVVLATFGAGPAVAVKAIAGAGAFAILTIGLGPRLLAGLGRAADRAGGVDHPLLAVVLMLFLLAAFAMDWAGMHAVFGGFLLGTAMPRGTLTRDLKAKLEPITTVLLVPVFFTYSGLNTKLGVITDPALLGVAGAILAASVLAKFGACWAAARLTGQDNPTALGIGSLMNARGLMELILINIGLQRGLIGVPLFSILVLMAVLTTLMTSPLFEVVYGRKARERGELGALNEVIDDPSGAPVQA